MKNKYLIAVLILSLFSACTKDFDEINTNPNSPESVPQTNLLISGITRSMDRIGGASMNMTYAGLWAQHYAKIQYIDEDYYQFRESTLEGHWNGLYAGPLQDLEDIITNPETGANMKAAAMTMRAYVFSVTTDMWGAVPYTQALNVVEVVQPVYDSQESIYKDLVSQLETAAGMFSAGGDLLGSGDVLYGGDVDKWKKLANSLRARLLNRMKHKDSAAASALDQLLSNSSNLLESNDDNAILVYPGDAQYSNPIYENKYVSGRNDHAMSKTMIDLLSSINDPRLSLYAEQNNNGEYVGQPNGSEQPTNLTDVSPIGAAFRDDPNAGVPLMTYDEVLFIKAEAMNDKQAYMDGITASMERWNLIASDDYMSAAGSFYDSGDLEAVITHKWISLFANGAEAFSEYRRTGYPSTVEEVPGSAYPGAGVPHRFAYPSIENATNGANVSKATSDQNINSGEPLHGDKMWWTM